MRTTLENSSEFKISISDELKFLKLYVEVQNIRFNNQVKFKAIFSPELDKYKKLIPPMLIQPLIENCFEHAFDETIKIPKITLELKKENDMVFILVRDNGKGILQTINTTRKSKALQLVEERILLLGKSNLFYFNNLEQGTEISIQIKID